MNFLQRTLLYQGGKVRYGTAGTTTTTTLASSGGLLINIDSATGDIARNSNGWLENNEALGWYINRAATNVSVEADTAVMLDGHKTLKLTVDASGRVKAFMYDVTGASGYNQKYMKPAKPSTKYKITCKVKTTNVATNSAFLLVEQFNSALGLVTSANTTALTGTNDFTNIVYEVTTSATTSYISINPHLNVAGNASDAWFGVATMTFDEVIEPVANSLTSSSPSLVSLQAVGSTDNIDQSFTTAPDGSSSVGNFGGLQYIESQSFTATKSKLTGVYIYKQADSGTPTGNFKVDIRTDNAGSPSATILATYTIPLATYTALSVGEFLVNLPCNLTAGTLYWIVVTNTATEALNIRFNVGAKAAGGYAGGLQKYSTDGGATWLPNGTADIYFKTLYYKPTTNFKASQNNSTVSISADEDGFLNGSVINLVTGTATFTETFGTFYFLQYTVSGSDLIAEINLPGVGLSASFTSDRTLEYSSDGVTYGATFPTGFSKVWVKILAYSGFASFSYSIQFSNSGISVLRNYPTNKDIIKQYSTTLGSATTSATYRATKWGFPAIEYSATEYQYLDVDTIATGSTVAFSELGTTYTTVADGASLAITSTSTPNIFVKANITANRLYLSSNDYNASSDKDGSLKQSVVYKVVQ